MKHAICSPAGFIIIIMLAFMGWCTTMEVIDKLFPEPLHAAEAPAEFDWNKPLVPEGYALVCSDTREKMVASVKQMIKEGWIPQGGVAFTNFGATWVQAMVKY